MPIISRNDLFLLQTQRNLSKQGKKLAERLQDEIQIREKKGEPYVETLFVTREEANILGIFETKEMSEEDNIRLQQMKDAIILFTNVLIYPEKEENKRIFGDFICAFSQAKEEIEERSAQIIKEEQLIPEYMPHSPNLNNNDKNVKLMDAIIKRVKSTYLPEESRKKQFRDIS